MHDSLYNPFSTACGSCAGRIAFHAQIPYTPSEYALIAEVSSRVQDVSDGLQRRDWH